MSSRDSVAETLTLPSVGSADRGPARPAAILVEGSGPALTDETNSLLRKRLRLASLLLSAGFLAFLIDRIWAIDQLTSSLHWFVFGSHIAVAGVTGVVGWRLCRNCRFAGKNLRLTELIVFGGSGVFFGVVSYSALVDGAAQGYVASTTPMWMTLVFTYALFIPNSWQRAALVVGTITAAAIGILLLVRFTTDGLDVLITDASYRKQGILATR